uniref:USP domain-containing protein n=1 Tax=Knipowitschia caucasica TaxID=637954 RepID=A0AAV2L0B8_KNICA
MCRSNKTKVCSISAVVQGLPTVFPGSPGASGSRAQPLSTPPSPAPLTLIEETPEEDGLPHMDEALSESRSTTTERPDTEETRPQKRPTTESTTIEEDQTTEEDQTNTFVQSIIWDQTTDTEDEDEEDEEPNPLPAHLSMGEPMTSVQVLSETDLELVGDAGRSRKRRLNLENCGLPNGAYWCYQNAVVQLLRTAEPVMSTLSAQATVWAHCEEAELLRNIHDLAEAPYTEASVCMTTLVQSFRQTVAVSAPMFGGSEQQDVHEFLMSLMELQSHGVNICGQGSSRQETFTILSLDLLPDSVLILHLKRFAYDHNWNMQKLKYKVKLDKRIVVKSKQDTAQFNLVNVISHLGPSTNSGTIIGFSEILQKVQVCLVEGGAKEPWLTYNDRTVSQTDRKTVCGLREREAYILTYLREGLYGGGNLRVGVASGRGLHPHYRREGL